MQPIYYLCNLAVCVINSRVAVQCSCAITRPCLLSQLQCPTIGLCPEEVLWNWYFPLTSPVMASTPTQEACHRWSIFSSKDYKPRDRETRAYW